MSRARESVHRRAWRRALRRLPALALLAAVAGCAPMARPVIPAELPLTTHDQIFTIRWALQKEASLTRAVGTLTTSTSAPARATLGLFGLDAGGRIVSRGTSWVRPSSFGSPSMPFSVELTPTGQEARYDLRVLDYHMPGFRMD